jgi:hypothetical protein
MRVVALGFWSGEEEDIEYITTERCLQLTREDVVIVDGQGDRLIWAYEGMHRRVANVLPTPDQKEELRTFLEQGGTIITFPADPFAIFTVPLYPEEIPESWKWRNYRFVVSGGLAEIEIPTFDWLPAPTWTLLKESYDIFCKRKPSVVQWKESSHLQAIVTRTIESIIIRVGSGKIIVCRGPSCVRHTLLTLSTMPELALQGEVA